jgi:hypothetical protein
MATLTSPINEQVFLSLAVVDQKKVEAIYAIAYALKVAKAKRISPRHFDHLYDLSLSELRDTQSTVEAQASERHY